MRALPGLLIEYLINGAVALVWIAPLLPPKIKPDGPTEALVLIPILYVLGMAIDAVAYWLVRQPKHALRNHLDRKFKVNVKYRTRRKAYILNKSSDIGEEIEKRSSRDRIARGTLVNLIPIAVTYKIHPLAVAGCFAVVFLMWLWFESQSYSFEAQAADILGYKEDICVATDDKNQPNQ